MKPATHAPATPLPWIVNQRKHVCAAAAGFADVATTANGSKTQVAVDDAAYIAHAANAYPRLVEALAELHAIDERKLAASERRTYAIGQSVIRERVERNRALLRELGEL